MASISGEDNMSMKCTTITLSSGWSFKQTGDKETTAWLPVKTIPSTVHQDLRENKQLEDPFIGFNEIKAEWVGTKSWTYRTTFQKPATFPEGRIVLTFDGLDTFAHVRLNDKTILESDNMFMPYRVDVTQAMKDEREHTLEIEFASALLRAREIEKTHPEHKWVCFNGETARLAVRKAQYHWGWDWGPVLMCVGIWKPIHLHCYRASITDIRTDVDVRTDYSSANVRVSAGVDHVGLQDAHAEVTISLDGKIVSSSKTSLTSSDKVVTDLRIDQPSLWMPTGYGSQNLYTVDVVLYCPEGELDRASRRSGVRMVELVQEPDCHGKSFYFRINGVDIFCAGSCWIPADSFLTNISPERYRAWIELMVPANQKMIRIWGGGIYEDEALYNACDELGILIWQDFMFGCGNYPCYPEIQKSITAEATANVKRLRHHPSIVIFAGNNEDYQVQEQSGLTYDYADKNEDHWLSSDFPARYIYELILPRVMQAEAPSIPYHPGSPWGDGKISSDPTVGDIHQWNVWHGTQEKYQIFDSLGGRFNSEFGMEAFPHLATIKSFVEDARDLYPQSRVLDFHNKADGHERRIATYLVENVRTATDLAAYIHLTQLVQCEALMFGYRGWRKQWGDSRHCGGALVWQLNDCWPTTSWSICDYYLRRKPSYYAMARVLAPLAVGIRRAHHDWSVTHAREPEAQDWELWIVSSRLESIKADVELRFISVESGREIKEKLVRTDVEVHPNGTTDITAGSVDNVNEEPHVLAARIWVDGTLVARDMDWPQPLKYLPFPNRNVTVDVRGDRMHITADRPTKCLVFEERERCQLSDSALDLAPGDEQVVTVTGLGAEAEPLTWTYLGAGEQ